MPVKMRLQRHGKKDQPFYHIVIADGRAPRDGRFIERLGSYNPLTSPATINIDFDKAMEWLKNGAQPTDTVRAILSYKGVLYKYHLVRGVAKGALTMEQVETKFQAWLTEKEAKISGAVSKKEQDARTAKKKALEAEAKAKEAKAAAILAKNTPAPAAEEVAEPVAEVAEEVEAPAAEEQTPETEA